jgi:hypothetical protein
MELNRTNLTREYLIREVQELEDAYAYALGDEADAGTLTVLWNKIKTLTYEIDELEKSEGKHSIK